MLILESREVRAPSARSWSRFPSHQLPILVGDFLHAKRDSGSPVMPSFPGDLLCQGKNPADLPHPRNSLMQSTEGQSVLLFSVRLKRHVLTNEYLKSVSICLFSFISRHKQGRLKSRQLKHAKVINTVTKAAN